MKEKWYVSTAQIGMLIFPVIVATADLLVPATIFKEADRDLWLSPLFASLTGYATVYLVFQLHQLFPKESIIEYSPRIVGPFLGKLCGLLVLFNLLYNVGYIIREYGEFIVGSFLYETPLLVVIGTIVLLCAVAVKAGLEVLARVAQVFVPVAVMLYALLMLLMLPSMKGENLFPVMEHGIVPVLKGAYTPQGWFSEVILFAFLLPYRVEKETGMRTGLLTVFTAMLALTLINLSTFLVLGEDVSDLNYPFYSAIQMISFADFFENIDLVVMAIWVTGAFIKISVFFYALALGTAQWLHLDDYRPLVLPFGFLLVVLSFWTAPNFSQLSANLQTFAGFQTTAIFMLIPLFLWLVARLRTGKKAGAEGMSSTRAK